MRVKLGIPNQTQRIRLSWVEPNEQNSRLFVELESLEELTGRYSRWRDDPHTVLPSPPVVRYRGQERKLELLGGHRRVMAASLAGLTWLPMRLVEMEDQEAYEFLLEANHYAEITTAEKAFKAAEMLRLGFSEERIGKLLGGVAANRYAGVGQLIHPEMFTNLPKLCDPSITLWREAAQFGTEHFLYCFRNWDAGVWDEAACWTKFRRRGIDLPLDNTEKGIRMSTSADGRRLKIRGTLDLDLYTEEELRQVAELFIRDFRYSIRNGICNRDEEGFGLRVVTNYNPISLEELL